jgi:putative Holliday junction resolvase
MMRLLGIDYGRARIGLAVAGGAGSVIRGLTTIRRHDTAGAADSVVKIVQRERPDALVVGIPLDPDDNETAMSEEARGFGRMLHAMTGLPVHLVDESLSSRRAREIMLSRRKKQRRDKGAVDRIAACLILERFQKEQQCGHPE